MKTMIHTNRCKHCGHEMALHHYETGQCLLNGIEVLNGPQQWANTVFTDSGLAALDAHKEELYEKAKALIECDDADNFTRHKMRALKEVLNQIEKEK